jgi:hypothetical protein
VWPIGSWVLGRATLPEALAEAGLLLMLTAVGGLIFGYLYYRTNNLWTLIETSTRLDAETDLALFGRVGFLSVVLIARFVATPARIPPLRPWGTDDPSGYFAPAVGGGR